MERYDEFARDLPARREELRAILRKELLGSHPRTPDNAAALIAALELLKEYTVSAGAMKQEEVEEGFEEAREGVLEAVKAHAEATSGGDPATRFLELLRSLLEAGRVHLRDRETGGMPPDCSQLGWSVSASAGAGSSYEPQGDLIGWADEGYLYLQPDPAYAAVSAFAQRGGIPFGIKPRALFEALTRSGTSLADAGRTSTTAKVGGKSRRVIQLPRQAVLEQG